MATTTTKARKGSTKARKTYDGPTAEEKLCTALVAVSYTHLTLPTILLV